jgi:hypothetical protein
MDKVHKTITTQQIDSPYACDPHSKGHQLLPTFKQGSLGRCNLRLKVLLLNILPSARSL